MKIIKHLLTIATLGLLTSTASAQSWITNGLVAYYPFNGNANDASGNGWNGTPVNSNGVSITASYSAGVLGSSRLAVNLSGGSFIDLGLSISPSVPTGLTQSFWVKSNQQLVPSNVAGETERIIFLTRRTGMTLDANETGGGGWPTLCINFNGNLAIWVDDYFYGDETQIANVPSTQVLDGKWHQVVGIKNGTAYSLFLDGILVGQFTDTHQLSDSDGTRHIWLGRNWGIYPQPAEFANCNGELCDVRIYNRALATNEVSQLYAIESAPIVGLAYAVKPTFSNLAIGTNYQLQVSTSLTGTFTNSGSPFTATNSTMAYPQYFDVANWNQFFFRLQVP
jgi:hypothetical protein